jgi:signal transduction histidine kinase
VTVFKEKDTFRITIKDNGKGFDEDEMLSGNGMNNLKKRAKEIKGEITITSQEQLGTTVVLCFKKP